jgi:hypothetical protein
VFAIQTAFGTSLDLGCFNYLKLLIQLSTAVLIVLQNRLCPLYFCNLISHPSVAVRRRWAGRRAPSISSAELSDKEEETELRANLLPST